MLEAGLGTKFPATPEGFPLSENVTGELNPPDGVIVIVEVPRLPCEMATDDAAKEKSAVGGVGVGTVITAVAIVAGPSVNTLPFIAVFAPTVIAAALVIIVPWKLLFAPSVEAPVTTQKT